MAGKFQEKIHNMITNNKGDKHEMYVAVNKEIREQAFELSDESERLRIIEDDINYVDDDLKKEMIDYFDDASKKHLEDMADFVNTIDKVRVEVPLEHKTCSVICQADKDGELSEVSGFDVKRKFWANDLYRGPSESYGVTDPRYKASSESIDYSAQSDSFDYDEGVNPFALEREQENVVERAHRIGLTNEQQMENHTQEQTRGKTDIHHRVLDDLIDEYDGNDFDDEFEM